jgi:predicted small secreted protein
MKTIRLLALAALALFALTACNTIAGIGKDVKKAGEVVADTAEDCKGGCDD